MLNVTAIAFLLWGGMKRERFPVTISAMTDVRQAKPLPFPDSPPLRYLPEGPIPLGEGRCSWVAIQHGPTATRGSLNLLDLNRGENQSWDLPGRPGFAIPCTAPQTFVIGCERSLGLFDTVSRRWQPFCERIDEDVENTIINDGMVYRDNLIFGTKDLQFSEPKAGLYLFRGQDQQLIRLRDDQICSNGKAILETDEGTTLLDIDSPTRKLVAYRLDIAAGTLSPPRTVIDFAGDPAVPDGAILTPDRTGIIVAMFHPGAAEYGQTRWYDLASGDLRAVWQTPGSPQNTCPALVPQGEQLKLLITTAVEHLSAADRAACPQAGQLFIADTDFAAADGSAAGEVFGDRYPASID